MESSKQDWNVFCSDAKRNAFLLGDASRNAYGSHYHVREPETQLLRMTFPGFVESLQAWQSRRLLLQVRLWRRVNSGPGNFLQQPFLGSVQCKATACKLR